VTLQFSEVISERPTGAPNLSGLFLISPSVGDPVVEWHRNRLEVRPRGGFRANTTYTVTMLPGLTDLESNVDSTGAAIVFSTGATIAQGRISGALFDWVGDKSVPRGVVEAISLPDSTHYVAAADSLGEFVVAHLPDGPYLLRGLVDQNRNRRADLRELFDTATVTLKDSLTRDLFAFLHDTLGPSISAVTVRDSLTLRVTLDRALDTAFVVSAGIFALKAADSSDVPIASVMTQRMFDRRVADSLRLKAIDDSVKAAAAADSARRADSARVNARIERPAGRRAVAAGAPDSAARDTAQRKARTPGIQIPAVDLVVMLEKPLPPGAVFRVRANGMRSLLGYERSSERLFRTARAKEDADSTKKTGKDSTKRPIPPDTGRPAQFTPSARRQQELQLVARLLGTSRPR
jgi:hypothetical protein